MKNDDVSRPGEVTDEELDRFLATGDGELLDHIQATTDPNRLLTEIMDRLGPEAPDPGIGHAPEQAQAREMIRMRAFATRLDRDLALVLARARDLTRDLNPIRDRDLVRACVRARDRALDLTRDLKDTLTRDRDLARALNPDRALDPDLALDRDLALTLARAHALTLTLTRARARDLEEALDRAHSSARRVASRLNAKQVDASDADLSDVEIEHIEALDGVVWTRRTIWPPDIAGQVEEHSAEIGDGVYQVRLGQRDEARV